MCDRVQCRRCLRQAGYATGRGRLRAPLPSMTRLAISAPVRNLDQHLAGIMTAVGERPRGNKAASVRRRQSAHRRIPRVRNLGRWLARTAAHLLSSLPSGYCVPPRLPRGLPELSAGLRSGRGAQSLDRRQPRPVPQRLPKYLRPVAEVRSFTYRRPPLAERDAPCRGIFGKRGSWNPPCGVIFSYSLVVSQRTEHSI